MPPGECPGVDIAFMSSPAKLGHAVRRNRVRRRLREAYRLNEGRFSRGVDLVIVVRGRGMDAPYRVLETELLELAGRLELLV